MKIILTKDTMVEGKPVSKGRTIEVSDDEGKLLVSEKKAKKIGVDAEIETEREAGSEPEEHSNSDSEPNKGAEE